METREIYRKHGFYILKYQYTTGGAAFEVFDEDRNFIGTTTVEHPNWDTFLRGLLKRRIKTSVGSIEILRKELTQIELEITRLAEDIDTYETAIRAISGGGLEELNKKETE